MNYFQRIFLVISICVLKYSTATIVNSGRPLGCSQIAIENVIIEGCDQEPCQLQRGRHLPVQFCFRFKEPASTSKIDFSVFASYWSVPDQGSYYGSYIEEGKTCNDFKIKCPAKAGRRYTLKTTVFADPEIMNRVDETNTGNMGTGWMITLKSNAKGSNTTQCSFMVDFDVTD